MKDFSERLERREDIEATRVTREETPDGPLHTHELLVKNQLNKLRWMP